MRAIVEYSDGAGRQLDAKAQPEEVVTEQDAADAPKLARLLARILRELAELQRSWSPRSILFRGVPVDATGTTVYTLTHRFRGPVNWSVVGWRDASAGAGLVEDADTDGLALRFVSYVAGTADILIEEQG